MLSWLETQNRKKWFSVLIFHHNWQLKTPGSLEFVDLWVGSWKDSSQSITLQPVPRVNHSTECGLPEPSWRPLILAQTFKKETGLPQGVGWQKKETVKGSSHTRHAAKPQVALWVTGLGPGCQKSANWSFTQHPLCLWLYLVNWDHSPCSTLW